MGHCAHRLFISSQSFPAQLKFLLSAKPWLPTTATCPAQSPTAFIICSSHQHLLTGYPVLQVWIAYTRPLKLVCKHLVKSSFSQPMPPGVGARQGKLINLFYCDNNIRILISLYTTPSTQTWAVSR